MSKFYEDVTIDPHTRYYQFTIICTLGVYLYYLIYRLLYTINPNALVFSLAFYYAELHGFIALSLYFFRLWNPIQRKPPPCMPGLLVDVFIVTYNEDITILRKTVLGCIDMSYPHRTYILDDGERYEVAQMAKELGCTYITRKERIHAKAGNLNHGLSHTNGEFIAIFDADYVPNIDFLEKTLGYFQDQRVSFVQTPHNYYNVDSFQFKLKPEKRKIWNEQDVFYRMMMPGMDYWGSIFFAGTAAVFRRKALEDIGGFAVESITEDIHTTIKLYKKGWKGVYHNEVLASGLAANDLRSYHLQKLRWAEGNVSLLFKDNPIFTRGLTFPQRICLFSTIFGWFIGFPKLIYFIAPAIMLLTGWYPIAPFDWSFIQRYLIFLTVIILGFKIASRGYGRIRYDEVYNMMNFFILIKAVIRNLFGLRQRFIVTRKGPGELPSILNIAPQIAVVLLCFSGVLWGLLKLFYRVSSDIIEIGIGSFWAAVNGLLAFSVVRDVTMPFYKRRDFRFIGAIPVQYSIVDKNLNGLGITKNLNEYGISLITFNPLPLGERLSLVLHLGKRILECKGTILYVADTGHLREKVFNYGIMFEGLSQKEMDFIRQFCFNAILPLFLQRFGKREPFLMRVFLYNRRLLRRSRRKWINLPLIVKWDFNIYSVTNDISKTGLSFISQVPLTLMTKITIEVFTPFGKMIVEGEVRQTREFVRDQSYLIGITFPRSFDDSRILSLVIREIA